MKIIEWNTSFGSIMLIILLPTNMQYRPTDRAREREREGVPRGLNGCSRQGAGSPG